ncbi:MAG: methyltransferase domain-containing protein [Bdellovibrionaceae bacterium]|nr:methyltransferase domain-containing protein [Pseudobdellovibrionaceae bacterium]
MKFVLVVLAVVAFLSCAHKHSEAPADHQQGNGHQGMQHDFKNAKKWSKAFDDPARDKWQKPDLVVQGLELRRAKCVADIGAGTGYFSTRIARALPQDSVVYAVDIEPDMVTHLKERAQAEGLKNHKEILSTEEFPTLPKKCDVVLLVDTYHHISNRAAYFKSGLSQLNPKGRVAVVDFTMTSPIGPKKSHRLEKSQVVTEMEQAGYKLHKDIDGLPNQYFLIFEKQ